MNPLTHSAKKNYQMDSKIKDMRKSYMIKEKFINNQKLLGVRVAKYLRVSRRCPNSKFPNFQISKLPKSHILVQTVVWDHAVGSPFRDLASFFYSGITLGGTFISKDPDCWGGPALLGRNAPVQTLHKTY